MSGNPLIAVDGGRDVLRSDLKRRFENLYAPRLDPTLLKEIYRSVMVPVKKEGFCAGDSFVFLGDLLHGGPTTMDDSHDRIVLFMAMDCAGETEFEKHQLHASSLMEAIHEDERGEKLRAVVCHRAVLKANEVEMRNYYDCSWPSLEVSKEDGKPAADTGHQSVRRTRERNDRSDDAGAPASTKRGRGRNVNTPLLHQRFQPLKNLSL